MSITNNGTVKRVSLMFDIRSNLWGNDRAHNFGVLRVLERDLNELLITHGFLTVLDIYRAFDLPFGDISRSDLLTAGWEYNDNQKDVIIFDVWPVGEFDYKVNLLNCKSLL